ncbi:hypothetical protein H9P43_005803 [Blastocladiella emersonii ATCC 22665]|nr:hypothetical protein H9P43_005803 [Blastocladiella emersonii ATCC 22665]
MNHQHYGGQYGGHPGAPPQQQQQGYPAHPQNHQQQQQQYYQQQQPGQMQLQPMGMGGGGMPMGMAPAMGMPMGGMPGMPGMAPPAMHMGGMPMPPQPKHTLLELDRMAAEFLPAGNITSSLQVAEIRSAAELLRSYYAEHYAMLEYQCMQANGFMQQQSPGAQMQPQFQQQMQQMQQMQHLQAEFGHVRWIMEQLDAFSRDAQRLAALNPGVASAYEAQQAALKNNVQAGAAAAPAPTPAPIPVPAPSRAGLPASPAPTAPASATGSSFPSPTISAASTSQSALYPMAPNAGPYMASSKPSYPLAGPAAGPAHPLDVTARPAVTLDLDGADRDLVTRLQRGGPRYSTTKVSGVGERDRYWTRDPVEFLDMLREYAAPLPLAVALSVVAEDLDADVRDRLAAVGFSGAMPDSQAGAAFLAVLFGDAQPEHLHRWTCEWREASAEQLAGKPVPAVLRTFLSHLSRLGPVEALQSGTLFKAEFARTLSVAQCIPRESAALLPALLVDPTVTCAGLVDRLGAVSVAARPGACRFCAAIENKRDTEHRVEECPHLHRLSVLVRSCVGGMQTAGVAIPAGNPLERTQAALEGLLASRVSLYDRVKRAISAFEAFTVLSHDLPRRDDALTRLWAQIDAEQGGGGGGGDVAMGGVSAGGFGAR